MIMFKEVDISSSVYNKHFQVLYVPSVSEHKLGISSFYIVFDGFYVYMYVRQIWIFTQFKNHVQICLIHLHLWISFSVVHTRCS